MGSRFGRALSQWTCFPQTVAWRMGSFGLGAMLLLPTTSRAAYDLLLMEPDARAAACGESSLALSSGISGWHQQPAAISLQQGESLVLNYVDHVQDLRLLATSWGSDRWAPWNLGLSVVHLDFGTLEGLDDAGASTGEFQAGETLLLAGTGRRLPDVAGGTVHAGVHAGWLGGRIEDARSQALLCGGGLLWNRGQLSLGAAMRNVGTVTSSYGSAKQELPRAQELGAAWRLAHLPFTFSVGWQRVLDRKAVVRTGGEFLVAHRWRVGLGYHVERGDERLAGVDGEASRGFSAGVGGTLPGGFDLQWAWTSFGELGSLNRLALAWRVRP